MGAGLWNLTNPMLKPDVLTHIQDNNLHLISYFHLM